ncbi:WhiB family transcriptional regulator [Rhodococcus sp. EPR-157]|uniref:WhiB family transcriptional regulator n=1 Tax=Rhodococcus sp. EPR-157 TaxID=1813677 RepID=UPI0009EEF07C
MLTGRDQPRIDDAPEHGLWRMRGACRQLPSDIFFPPPGNHRLRLERQAKTICGRCPVLMQCRSFAIAHQEPHGIWGGLTARERNRTARAVLRGRSRPTLRQNDIR